MTNFREYQVAAMHNVVESFRNGYKRVVVYSPTASGKSIMAVGLIEFLLRKGKRVAFVANRIGLVKQFSAHLTAANILHGIIQGDNTINTRDKCLVCSIDTLAKRGFPDRVDVIIVDEVHFVAQHKAAIAMLCHNPELRVIGLTATPFAKGMARPMDEFGGEPLFQDMVITSTIAKLIEGGFLVDCDIYAPTDPDLTGVKSKKNAYGEMDYIEMQLAAAMDKPDLIGDIVDNWIKLAGGRKTVLFAVNVNHSRNIVEQFNRRGIYAVHVDGYMTQEEKLPIMDEFEKGEALILSNVAMLKEGWDCPVASVMINAKPTRSLTAWIQQVGRVLRLHPDKDRAIIIDHSGSVHRLGLPTEDLPLSLCDGSAKKSASEKRAEQEEKKDRKCPKCALIKKTRVCAGCGYEPPAITDVVVEDGELTKVKKGSKADKQEWYSQLLGYAKDHGYKPGWAANQYRAKFTVWPRGLYDDACAPGVEVMGFIRHKQIAYAKSKQASRVAA